MKKVLVSYNFRTGNGGGLGFGDAICNISYEEFDIYALNNLKAEIAEKIDGGLNVRAGDIAIMNIVDLGKFEEKRK